MRTIIVGGDIGNHALKLVAGVGNRLYLVNAVKEVSVGTERKSLGEDEQILDTLDVFIRCPHLPELHERRFFVGNLAIGKNEYQVSPDTRKMENPLILVPFLTGLALQSNQRDEHLLVEATMGLPMAEFLEKSQRKDFEQKITGEYEIEFVSTAKMEGWKVKIQLKPSLSPEGMAVILHQMTDRFGRNIRPDWNGQAMGAIDIGGFSTDMSAIGTDHRPDPDLCEGFQLGTITAIDEIIKEINRIYKIKFPRHMIEKTITTDNCQLQLGAKKIDIHDLVESNFRSISNQIAQAVLEVAKKPKAAMIHRYFVFGGGALKYQKFMEKELQERMYSELLWLTTDPKETLFLNAESFYRLAMMKSIRDASHMLKAKEA